MNLSELPAAPWKTFGQRYVQNEAGLLLVSNGDASGAAAVEFAALARNALDVMLRRGWSAVEDVESPYPDKWYVVNNRGVGIDCSTVSGTKRYHLHADPFTALVAADEWYKANVEAKP